ncbi:MAG: hypothetical protein ACRDSR_27250 [Pseudonocardiaceae bacterium]
MSSRVGRALVVVAAVSAVAIPLAATEASATDYNFACNNIRPIEGYEPCIGDRWSIAPGQFVRIKNVSAGGKSVTFRAYNVSGHHLLGQTRKLSQGDTGLVWRNDTSRNISIDIEADPDANFVEVNVNARASITRT